MAYTDYRNFNIWKNLMFYCCHIPPQVQNCWMRHGWKKSSQKSDDMNTNFRILEYLKKYHSSASFDFQDSNAMIKI